MVALLNLTLAQKQFEEFVRLSPHGLFFKSKEAN